MSELSNRVEKYPEAFVGHSHWSKSWGEREEPRVVLQRKAFSPVANRVWAFFAAPLSPFVCSSLSCLCCSFIGLCSQLVPVESNENWAKDILPLLPYFQRWKRHMPTNLSFSLSFSLSHQKIWIENQGFAIEREGTLLLCHFEGWINNSEIRWQWAD